MISTSTVRRPDRRTFRNRRCEQLSRRGACVRAKWECLDPPGDTDGHDGPRELEFRERYVALSGDTALVGPAKATCSPAAVEHGFSRHPWSCRLDPLG